MSNLSELLPAGAGAKSAKFVASGTLSSGQTVALKADGTVEAISATGGGSTVGTPSVFNTVTPTKMDSTYDTTQNKLIVAANVTYPYACEVSVGTVSGSTITFGTAVSANASTGAVALTYDPTSQRVLVFYQDTSNNQGKVKAGTVSGTGASGTISFGSATAFSGTTQAYDIGATYDTTNNKFVVMFYGSGGTTEMRVGTVSGSTISMGSQASLPSSAQSFLSPFTGNVVFDSSANQVVCAYTDALQSYKGYVVTYNASNNTFGTPVEFDPNAPNQACLAFDSTANKVILGFRDTSNSNYGTARVLTLSGSSITLATSVVFASVNMNNTAVSYDASRNVTVASYSVNSGTGTLNVGTLSGTTISFGSSFAYATYATGLNTSVYDPDTSQVLLSDQNNTVGNGTSVAVVPVSSNNTDFVGITDEAISSAASGSVVVQGGVNGKVTGLTIGTDYYVQTDGTLNTTVTTVPAGRALSTTSILLEG